MEDSRHQVRTGCPYCGVGCGLVATVSEGQLQSVHGDKTHPVNRGRTCQKPLALPEATRSADRAVTPLWRADRQGRFEPLGWDAMLSRLAEVGASVPALPREWGDYFTRVVMPPVRVEGFNMSSVSQAS